MLNTHLKSFKSSTLLVTTSLLCVASLGTAAQAGEALHPPPGGGEVFTGPGHTCVAIRHDGAAHFGHIGWGVEVFRDHYLFGAVEGKSSNGSSGWYKEGTWADMLAAFEKAALRPGHAGRALRTRSGRGEVSRPNMTRAWLEARTMQNRSRNYT